MNVFDDVVASRPFGGPAIDVETFGKSTHAPTSLLSVVSSRGSVHFDVDLSKLSLSLYFRKLISTTKW